MKKIVFFDVDGTLVNDNKEIPASARKAVKDLQDKAYTLRLHQVGRRFY